MCYYDRTMKDPMYKQLEEKQKHDLLELYRLSLVDSFTPKYISLNTYGESFLYLDEYKKFTDIIKKIEEEKNIKVYTHIYTNGMYCDKNNLLKAKNMGIDEIRFHISALKFSEKILTYMHDAKQMGFVITVEEPSWLLHKTDLIYCLDLFNDIGIKHLDMVEVQITNNNFDAIDKAYPDGRYYKNALYHLYDEGLVYDIIEEVIRKKYNFSVLDCNSDVDRYRQTNCSIPTNPDIMKGACADI